MLTLSKEATVMLDGPCPFVTLFFFKEALVGCLGIVISIL